MPATIYGSRFTTGATIHFLIFRFFWKDLESQLGARILRDSQGFSGILQSVFKECSSISEPLRESQRIRANQMKEGKSKKRAVTVCVPVDRCTGAEVLKKTGKDNRKRTNCSFCCCCCKINRKFLKSFKKTRKNLKDSLDKSSQQITCSLTSTSGGQLAQLPQES